MDGKSFSVGEVISEAWKFTKDHLGYLLSFMVIYFLINGLFTALNYKTDSVPISLLGTVITTFIYMGLYNSALLITEGVRPNLDQLYANWAKFAPWILASILFGLMLLAGLALLIVPGLYLLARYGLYTFFILDRDKNLGPIEALKAAAKASEGHRWDLFLLYMSCFGLNLLGILLLGFGLLFTVPLTVIALAIAYRRLTGDVALITEP